MGLSYSLLCFIRVCVSYVFIDIIVVWEYYGDNILKGGICNNNNSGIFMSLYHVDLIFLFWSLFPIFPHIQTVTCLFYSQSDFIGSYFLYSHHRQTFSDLFSMHFYWLFFE